MSNYECPTCNEMIEGSTPHNCPNAQSFLTEMINNGKIVSINEQYQNRFNKMDNPKPSSGIKDKRR